METFGNGLSIGTSFGASGIVLIDLALQVQPDVDIFYIDTGFFFPETLTLILRARGLEAEELRAHQTFDAVAFVAQVFGAGRVTRPVRP